MLQALIVDDEPKARKNLENLITGYTAGVEVAGAVGNVADAISFIRKNEPDLVFLDVELQNESGFDVLAGIDEICFDVIFVTAYDQYAIKAFKYSAIDYLLKPVNIEELEDAVARVKSRRNTFLKEKRFKAMLSRLSETESNIIVFPTNEEMIFVKVNEIIRLESEDNYTKVLLKNRKPILVSKNIKHYEEILDPGTFFRIHRSHIINIQEIKSYVKGEKGYITTTDNAVIPVSRRKRLEFLQMLSK